MEILVIGCGVIGVTAAVRLREAGHDVTIWSRELPPHTTSDIPAAFWLPYEVAPLARVEAWSRRTFAVFEDLAKDPRSGVRAMAGKELFRVPQASEPWWSGIVRDFRRLSAAELPASCYREGYSYLSWLIEMPIYLRRFLLPRFVDGGGKVERREVQVLEEALESFHVVVNCTGLGARALTGDSLLYPLRGQVVRVSRPASDEFFMDDFNPAGMVYVFPRSEDCILGGSAVRDDWRTAPDAEETEAIRRRCAEAVPAVGNCRTLGVLVGLRPARDEVRLETERRDRGWVIHNYGHGGAGVTLSWGCAEDTVLAVEQLGS